MPLENEITDELIARQVEEYSQRWPLYEETAKFVVSHLQNLADGCAHGAVAAGRPKQIASFAEKLLRKRKYKNALVEVTDLVGARIVCEFDSDVRVICRAIRARFDNAIDEVNSLDQRTLLRAGEFGYRSVHYVIELRKEQWNGLHNEMEGVKIEVQVRTRLQHIWSELGHDRVYKSPYALPDTIKREVSRIAAQFESLDEEFERVVSTIADYRTHFGAYLDEAKFASEKALQLALRTHDSANPRVPLRLAELALAKDAWGESVEHVRKFAGEGHALTSSLKTALGFGLCQVDPLNRRRPEFEEGLALLREGAEENPSDVMAWVRLAACLEKELDKVPCFQRAYRADPGDPVALAGLLETHLNTTGDISIVPLVRPAIREALERCERQIETKVDLPWAHFRAGWFALLLADDDGSSLRQNLCDNTVNKQHKDSQLNAALKHYLRGIALTDASPDSTPIRLAADAANALGRRQELARLDVQISILLLEFVLNLRRGGTELKRWLEQHATCEQKAENEAHKDSAERGRVCIVVGSAKEGFLEKRDEYERILHLALGEYRGTVISGGTEQGVPGLVGKIGHQAKDRITLVGYLPAGFDSTSTSTIDKRYANFRRTKGARFSQMEPLQAWIDLVSAGIRPEDVTVLGFGGGRIAAFEYRLALVLGARVGVIADSGREAEILAKDPDWFDEKWGLQRIPFAATDAATMRAFMNPPQPQAGFNYERLGELVHRKYIAQNQGKLLPKKITDWALIGEELQQSNKEQVMAAPDILATEGYELVPLASAMTPSRPPYMDDEAALERMAKLEHGRWVCERLCNGWRYKDPKTRDNGQKIHPDLVAWEKLPPEVQALDLRAIRNYGEIFAEAGFAIVKRETG